MTAHPPEVEGRINVAIGDSEVTINCGQRYEIRVGGRLGDIIRSAFPDLTIRTRDEDTILSGVFADQAALYGTLAQTEALGLELIEVRRLPPA